MVGIEELMFGLTRFGRRNIQDFVLRSNDVNDVIAYLQVELYSKLTQAMSFRTMDSVTFERQEALEYPPIRPHQDMYQSYLLMSTNITHTIIG